MPDFESAVVVRRASMYALYSHRCRPEHARAGAEEYSPEGSICLTRAGVYVKHLGRRNIVADANHVVFYNSGVPYRVSHPAQIGDDCTVLTLERELKREIVSLVDPAIAEREQPLFPGTGAISSPALVLFMNRIVAWARTAGADPLAMDEMVLAFTAAAVRSATDNDGRPVGVRLATRAAHCATAEATMALLAHRYAENLTLPQIAREVAASPFHLARLFRRETGMSIHRYLNRLRLREGMERLPDTRDLTGLALDLGFASHSHFTDAFRREFGLPPSRLRAGLSGAELSRMRRNLEA